MYKYVARWNKLTVINTLFKFSWPSYDIIKKHSLTKYFDVNCEQSMRKSWTLYPLCGHVRFYNNFVIQRKY